MKVTVKGQVTIPQNIRERLHITPASEVDFVEAEDGRIYLIKRETPAERSRFARLRGTATVNMTTEEIMALTRDLP